MANNLRISIIIGLLIVMVGIYKTIKRKKLTMKYGMYWTLVFLCMLLLLIFPKIIEWLALKLGFKEAPHMLFLFAIFCLFYISFKIYTSISKLTESNKNLVQELSILKHEINNKR